MKILNKYNHLLNQDVSNEQFMELMLILYIALANSNRKLIRATCTIIYRNRSIITEIVIFSGRISFERYKKRHNSQMYDNV